MKATKVSDNGAGIITENRLEQVGAPASLAVSIPAIAIRQMQITLVGDSPLITHKWSDKAKQMMLDKQTKKPKQAKEAKDPEQQYRDSRHVIEDGVYGFPCIGFKKAAVGACRFVDGVRMTEARGSFHVVGELARIDGEPRMREDMVRLESGVADIRYRAEFPEWRVTLTISYNAGALSPSQIINLFNIAGFGVGVGEWRPQKDGPYGRFHVLREGEAGEVGSGEVR